MEHNAGQQAMILVKLFATLREGRGKTVLVPYQENLTPRDILEELKIPPEEVAIHLINGRDGRLDQILGPQDYLSFFPPMGGG